jgi:hypothetical protein
MSPIGTGILDFAMLATMVLTLVQKATEVGENYTNGAKIMWVINIMLGQVHQRFGSKQNGMLSCLH